jgi:hypothetical protein
MAQGRKKGRRLVAKFSGKRATEISLSAFNWLGRHDFNAKTTQTHVGPFARRQQPD